MKIAWKPLSKFKSIPHAGGNTNSIQTLPTINYVPKEVQENPPFQNKYIQIELSLPYITRVAGSFSFNSTGIFLPQLRVRCRFYFYDIISTICILYPHSLFAYTLDNRRHTTAALLNGLLANKTLPHTISSGTAIKLSSSSSLPNFGQN